MINSVFKMLKFAGVNQSLSVVKCMPGGVFDLDYRHQSALYPSAHAGGELSVSFSSGRSLFAGSGAEVE
jgi:hypothetical protein